MESRYTGWAGPLQEVGRFQWERIIKKCTFKQSATTLLALILATYASEDGSSVRPGLTRLMAASGLSKGYISTQMGKLEDLGLVVKLHNGSSYGRRGGLASVYRLTAPDEFCQLYQEDPSELAQVNVEQAFEHWKKQEQFHPSATVQASESQEQFQSAPEQFHSDGEQFHSDGEQFHPSVTHQALTPINNHHPKITNHFAASSPKLTHASEPVDNSGIGAYTGQGMEHERRRQMDALQKRMEEEKRIAS